MWVIWVILIVMVGDAEIHNEVSGSVAGGVVQARTVVGGVHEGAQHAHASGNAEIRQAGRDQYNAGGDVYVHPSEQPMVVPQQLPPAPRLFTGRADELEALTAALGDATQRGVPVVISAIGGAGGIGKTWLALHWAHCHAHRFPDGQLFVNLRGFDPSGQPMTQAEAVRGLLDALGVAPQSIPVDLEAQVGRYRSLVASKRILIVLDNARDASQVAPLLPGSPTCMVLVTSRDRMEGLTVAHGVHQLAVGVLDDSDARGLLSHRIGQARVEAQPAAVAELLTCCAGLPLALSIVAGRAAATGLDFPLAVLAEELRDASTRLGALDTGDPKTALEAVLSWSYHALTGQQARAFALVGIAPGPNIGLEAAASLTDLPMAQVRAVLRALSRVSLVDDHTPGRYGMHDLIRLYAAKQADHDLAEAVREAALRRVSSYYLHTVYAADRLLDPHRESAELDPPMLGFPPRSFRDDTEALAWLDTEHPCLLSAQDLAVARGWQMLAWQLCPTLHTYHWRRGRFSKQVVVARAGLAAAQHTGVPAIQALAHRLLAEACAFGGQHAEAQFHLREALSLSERTGDLVSQAHTRRVLAWAAGHEGKIEQALEHITRALDLFQEAGDEEWEARALNQTAWYLALSGQYELASTRVDVALSLHRRHRNRSGEALSLGIKGLLAFHADHHTQAVGHYHQALTLLRETGHTYFEAQILDYLGDAHAALDTHDQARYAWARALELYRTQNRDADADDVQQRLAALGERPDPTES